jgi:hypothetical protein
MIPHPDDQKVRIEMLIGHLTELLTPSRDLVKALRARVNTSNGGRWAAEPGQGGPADMRVQIPAYLKRGLTAAVATIMLSTGSVSAKEPNVIFLSDHLTDAADGVCQGHGNEPDMRSFCRTLPPMAQRREFINAIRVEFTTMAACAGLAMLSPDLSREESSEERSAKGDNRDFHLFVSHDVGLKPGHVLWELDGPTGALIAEGKSTPREIVAKVCGAANGKGGRIIQ